VGRRLHPQEMAIGRLANGLQTQKCRRNRTSRPARYQQSYGRKIQWKWITYEEEPKVWITYGAGGSLLIFKLEFREMLWRKSQ